MVTETVLPNPASQPWSSPAVEASIAQHVMYQPISDASVKAIPIHESHETAIDLLNIDNPRLRPLAQFNPKFANTFDDFSKIRQTVYQKLLAMLDILPNNIGIAYFEAYRPLAIQKKYFDHKFKEILEIMPDIEQAYQETTKHVSPFIDNIPTHSTGAAIDMTLFMIKDHEATRLDMGKFDVIFGPNDQQETFSTNTTQTQRKNRLLLLHAATQAGLANYGYEWWHYSYGDKMWAIVYQQKAAKYGTLADANDPILKIKKRDYLKEIEAQITPHDREKPSS